MPKYVIKKKKEPAYLGIVIDIQKDERSISSIVQGVKQQDQKDYNPPGYFGDNGTYRIDYPNVKRYLYLFVRFQDNEVKRIDVRDDALKMNNRINVSEKMIDTLKKKMTGNEYRFMLLQDRSYLLDKEALKLE